MKFFKNGQAHTLKAFREVIVSGGVFETPKLLQLSGVGPTPVLRKFKVCVYEKNTARNKIANVFCDVHSERLSNSC